KIKQALDMPEEEQQFRMENMQQRVRSYDVNHWANDFLFQLKETHGRQLQYAVRFLGTWQKLKMAATYVVSKSRLLLIDYDGTLVGFSPKPELAVPPDELIKTLSPLSSSERNDIFIISGRSSKSLEDWFGKYPINLIAEHGAKT